MRCRLGASKSHLDGYRPMLNAFRQGLQKQSNPRHQVGRLHDLEAGKGDSSKPQHSALNSINGVRALCKTPAFVITIDNLCYRGGTWSLRGKEATPFSSCPAHTPAPPLPPPGH